MADILDFFSTLWSFVWALISNWIFYMTAFPLILDDLIKWCSPKLSSRIEAKLSGSRRRKAEIYLMFGGFFVASFMAFDGERTARTKAESDNQLLAKELATMSPSGQAEQIIGLKKTLDSEKITFSEIELKQQGEIDSLKKASDPLSSPIASAIANITVNYALDSKVPAGGSINLGGAQIGFGLGNSPLLVAVNTGLPRTFTNGDGVETFTVECSVSPGPDSPYIGKPVSSLKDAGYLQIDSGVIPKNAKILGGTVRWVINGGIALNFSVPPQPADGTHISIRDLSEGFKQLSSTPDTSASQH